MKKILSLVTILILVFAVTALQADDKDKKTTSKDKSGCCSGMTKAKSKAHCDDAKASMSKEDCMKAGSEMKASMSKEDCMKACPDMKAGMSKEDCLKKCEEVKAKKTSSEKGTGS